MTKTALIMAGGYGERFWPMSRKDKPKQFLKFFGEDSLLNSTYKRIRSFIPAKYIFIITGKVWEGKVIQSLPELAKENLILEPYRRDTALALGFSTVYIKKRHPDASIFICPCDHSIQNQQKLTNIIIDGFEQLKKTSHLICIGIQASYPAVGYGYIELGEKTNGTKNIYKVRAFIEKPDRLLALEYCESGNYLWNTGMFIWRADIFLKEIEEHLPEIYQEVQEIEKALGSKWEKEIVNKVFEQSIKISIDYGLMEKSKNILCIRGDFAWDDLGSWESMVRILESDEKDKNIQRGKVVLLDSENSMILNDDDETLIASIGLKDFLVVKSKNAILICKKSQEQKVKLLLKAIQEKYFEKYI